MWTDSRVTLAWIRSNREYKTFVQNRINEIQKLKNKNDLFYCPTRDNPADIITRSERNDILNSMWLNGSNFLHDVNIKFANEIDFDELRETELSAPTTVNVNAMINAYSARSANNVIDFERYSSYKKLPRVKS